MAVGGTTIGKLLVKLYLDDKGFKTGLKTTETQLMVTGRKMEAFGGKVTGALAAGLAVGVAAFGSFIASTIKVGAAFDQTVASLGALSGATGESLSALRDQARFLGKTTAFTATQAAEAMTELAKAGLDVEQNIAASSSVVKLAGAMNHDMSRTAGLVVSSLKQFNLTADESARVADVFAQASRTSQLDLSSLGEAMKYAGTTGSTFGMSLEETTAAVAMFRDLGLAGSQAGTQFRMTLSQAAKETSQKTSVLEKYNLTMKDINPETNKFADILQVVGDKAIGAKDAMIIFGTRAGANVSALAAKQKEARDSMADLKDQYDRGLINADEFKNAAAQLKELGYFTEQLGAAAGTTDEIYRQMMNTVQGQATISKSAFQDLQLTIYQGLEPAIFQLTKSLPEIFNTASESVDGVSDQISDYLLPVVDEFTQFLQDNAADFGTMFLDALKAIIDVSRALANVLPIAIQVAKVVATMFVTSKVIGFVQQLVTVGSALYNLPAAFAAASAGARAFTVALGAVGLGLAAVSLALSYYEGQAAAAEKRARENNKQTLERYKKEEKVLRQQLATAKLLVVNPARMGSTANVLQEILDGKRTFTKTVAAYEKAIKEREKVLDQDGSFHFMDARLGKLKLALERIKGQKEELEEVERIRGRLAQQGRMIKGAQILVDTEKEQREKRKAARKASAEQMEQLKKDAEKAKQDAAKALQDAKKLTGGKFKTPSGKKTKKDPLELYNEAEAAIIQMSLAASNAETKIRAEMKGTAETRELLMQREIDKVNEHVDAVVAEYGKGSDEHTVIEGLAAEARQDIRDKYGAKREKKEGEERANNRRQVVALLAQIELEGMNEVQKLQKEKSDQLKLLTTATEKERAAIANYYDKQITDARQQEADKRKAEAEGEKEKSVSIFKKGLSEMSQAAAQGGATVIKALKFIDDELLFSIGKVAGIVVTDVFKTSVKAVSGWASATKKSLSEIIEKPQGDLQKAFSATAKGIAVTAKVVGDVMGPPIMQAGKFAIGFLKTSAAGLMRIGTVVKGITTVALDMAKQAFDQIDKGLSMVAGVGFGDLFSAAKEGDTEDGTAQERIAEKMKEASTGFSNLASNIGPVFDTLIQGLPASVDMVVQKAPEIITAIVSRIPQLAQAIAEAIPAIVNVLAQSMGPIIQSITEAVTTILPALLQVVPTIIEGLGVAIAELVKMLPTVLNQLLQALPDIIVSVVGSLSTVIDALVEAVPIMIQGIIDNLPKIAMALVEGALNLIVQLAEALPMLIAGVAEKIPILVETLVSLLPEVILKIAEAAPLIITNLAEQLPRLISSLVSLLPNLIVAIINALPAIAMALGEAIFFDLLPRLPEMALKVAVGIAQGFIDGVKSFFSNLFNLDGDGFSLTEFLNPFDGKSGFQAGIPYIPNTMIAKLHEGERVIPAHDNPISGKFDGSSDMFGGMGGGKPIAVNVVAEGRLLDSVLITAKRRGNAPQMSKAMRRSSGAKVGFDRGQFNFSGS